MENPTFRLEGIVKTRSETEDFEGPLALILLLLNKNKIEIRDIRISDILDQYMAYLENWQQMDLEVASEFVSMASYLLYIKTKSLLVVEEEITELESLMQSLEQLKNRDSYSKIKCVIDRLRSMSVAGSDMLVKPQEYIAPVREYRYKHDKSDLIAAMSAVLSREEAQPVAIEKLIKVPNKPVYSVEDKADDIIKNLKSVKTMSVTRILMACKSRSELVAAFVALLDLCKSGNILLTDNNGDIEAEIA